MLSHMELLKEITEKDIGLNNSERFALPYVLRKAARAILFNNKNEIALLYVEKNKYHKLPGGGMEEGEDLHTVLAREALEEVGTRIKINDEVGIVIEYQNESALLQISYCYIAETVGDLKVPKFTDEEKNNGFRLLWAPFDIAVKLLLEDRPDDYTGKFIRERDLTFLQRAKQKMIYSGLKTEIVE